MKAGHIKGALLEYIVRQLLKNCGFSNVKADGLYSFENNGLFYVNGKGAAHDADIIMNPPIQMPFTYPTQLIFECKAYSNSANLAVIRNALGLRHDLNDFEIVTRDSIRNRKNNKRADYAIENRKRFIYQVGVASVNDFSKPAIEFAANNKIPLLSLNWFLNRGSINAFNSIDQQFIDSIDGDILQNIYDFLKDRDGVHTDIKYSLAFNFLRNNELLGNIVTFANLIIRNSFVGLLETGDMIFLFPTDESNSNILSNSGRFDDFQSEFHWFSNRPDIWHITIKRNIESSEFYFFLPKRILNHWKTFSHDKAMALKIKGDFFSKIFVFNKSQNSTLPFSIINIDRESLERMNRELTDD